MTHDRNAERWRRRAWIAVISGLLLVLMAQPIDGAAGRRTSPSKLRTAQPDSTVLVPLVRDTPANLQTAFDNEVNAKERYLAFAQQAEAEGFGAVAVLLRACATAESVHARRHVEAIAVIGGQARAVLERLVVGSTADNLRAAVFTESYEVDRWYPALLAQAKLEHRTEAVRSMAGARSAEREHLRLLSDALATLETHPPPHLLWVCSYCGKTVPSCPRSKCPNCFSPARQFLRVPATGLAEAAPAPSPVPHSPADVSPTHSRVR